MIKLYQFAPVWGIPNLGSFCAKIETVLRIAGVPYEIENALPVKAPKGKLLFIEDDGVKVADSRFILNHLRQSHGVDLDGDMDDDLREFCPQCPLKRTASVAAQ